MPDEVIDYLEQKIKQNQAAELANRGWLSSAVSNVASTIPEGMKGTYRQIRSIGDMAGLPGLERASTESIKDVEMFQKEHPTFQEPPNMGIVGRTVHGVLKGGVEFAPSLLAGGLPGAAAAGAQAFLGTRDESKERVKAAKPGISEEEANSLANKEAAISGVLTAGTLGGLHLLQPAAEGVVPTVSQYFKKIGTTGAAFGAQGAVGAGAQAEIEKRHGVGDKGFFEAAKEAAPEAIGTGLAFGAMDAFQLRNRIKNLQSIPEKGRSGAQNENLQKLLEYQERLALPAPESGGELGIPPGMGEGFKFYDVPAHETFSPELADALQKNNLLLPSGQGFVLRGNAADVLSRYSPELADELTGALKQLPEGQGFTLPSDDATKVHDLNQRIEARRTDAERVKTRYRSDGQAKNQSHQPARRHSGADRRTDKTKELILEAGAGSGSRTGQECSRISRGFPAGSRCRSEHEGERPTGPTAQAGTGDTR